MPKLTAAHVNHFRRLYEKGMSHRVIALRTGFPERVVWNAIHGFTYLAVGGPAPFPSSPAVIPPPRAPAEWTHCRDCGLFFLDARSERKPLCAECWSDTLRDFPAQQKGA